jgi:hypothetical protein
MYKKIIAGLLFVFFVSPTFAYFDPGTGAYIVQVLIAFLATVFFYLRNPIQIIKKLLIALRDKYRK